MVEFNSDETAKAPTVETILDWLSSSAATPAARVRTGYKEGSGIRWGCTQ